MSAAAQILESELSQCSPVVLLRIFVNRHVGIIETGIAFHVNDALEAGASHDEIVETIGVSVLMGGGPSVVYGINALNALKEFEKKNLVHH